MVQRRIVISAVAGVFLVVSGYGETIVVDPDGAGDFTEIQPAIDAAEDGDEVLVKPGVYEVSEPIRLNTLPDPEDPYLPLRSSLTLRGEAGADATTLRMAEGSPGSPVVLVDMGEPPTTVIEGFTVTGATARADDRNAQYDGGGIRILNRAAPTLRDCVIASNEAFRGGGILVGPECSATLERCTISDNSSIYGAGGGVALQGSDSSISMTDCVVSGNSASCGSLTPGMRLSGDGAGLSLVGETTLVRCTIAGNRACGFGGGIFLGTRVPLTATGCRILGNSAQRGGGLDACCARNDNIRLSDCVLAFNTAFLGAAATGTVSLDHCTVVGNGGGSALRGTPSLASCIVWGNDAAPIGGWGANVPAATYSCIEGSEVWPGEGNIATDPGFGAWADRAEWFVDAAAEEGGDGSEGHPVRDLASALAFDYRLASDSPCLGTGDAGTDMGAATGVCETRGAQARTLKIGPGSHPLPGISLAFNVSVQGAGEALTTLVGTVFGLGTGATLEDVTVTRGPEAGGLYVGDGEAPRVRRVTFYRNAGFPNGGAVYCGLSSAPTLTSCTITGNRGGQAGGGILCADGSRPVVEGCRIVGNLAEWSSGAIGVFPDATLTVRNSLIAGNSVEASGGSSGIAITCHDRSTLLLEHCTVTGTRSNGSPVLYCEEEARATVRNSIVWGNGGALPFGSDDDASFPVVEYCCLDGPLPPSGVGNLRRNPAFLNVGRFDFARRVTVVQGERLGIRLDLPDFVVVAGDFNLRSASPALDAGTSEGVGETDTDIAGRPRWCGESVDMGAYEACPAIATSFQRGDANGDGKVDISDPIWIISELYRDGPVSPCGDAADANDDGLRDLSDGIYLIRYCLLGGSKPPAPFSVCGSDSTSDELSCESYPPCG